MSAFPECEVVDCPRVRNAARYCQPHHRRLLKYGDPLAHIPIGSPPWLVQVAGEEFLAAVAYAPTPAEGRGFLWLA